MRPLPVADPGTPDKRSASRYLWWLIKNQWSTITGGMFFGIVWMLSGALQPAVIGKAVDAGISGGNASALAKWAGAFVLLGILQSIAGVLRHRNAVYNWIGAAFRTVQVAVAHTGKLGATVPDKLATGDVVAIGATDTAHIGNALDITARASAAVVTLVVITLILIDASPTLGLVVLLGVPVLMAVVALLIKPLHRRQLAYREQQGALTGRATDIVAGLRVLRGIGGEAAFADRYREESQELRTVGVRAAQVNSLMEAVQVLMPGLFLALVTWLGARFALAGEITTGELVSFYGYAFFLVIPLRTFTEALEKMTRGHVAAGRVLKLLRLEPDITAPANPMTLPAGRAPLIDVKSGLTVQPGIVTALAADRPEDASEIADRLGRYTEGEVMLGNVPLSQVGRSEIRERIMVSDNNSRLFSGPLRSELGEGSVQEALYAASAQEIVDALPDGLDEFVAERGREFSGGQQQRLRLARALLAEREILILVEPTSAVDAHTEARIAARLGDYRSGKTTLVTTTSPLLLDRADKVVYVEDGKVIAEGKHRDLLASEPRYRAVVTRGSSVAEECSDAEPGRLERPKGRA